MITWPAHSLSSAQDSCCLLSHWSASSGMLLKTCTYLELALSDVGTTGLPVGATHQHLPAHPPPGPSAGAGTCWGFWFLLF